MEIIWPNLFILQMRTLKPIGIGGLAQSHTACFCCLMHYWAKRPHRPNLEKMAGCCGPALTVVSLTLCTSHPSYFVFHKENSSCFLNIEGV